MDIISWEFGAKIGCFYFVVNDVYSKTCIINLYYHQLSYFSNYVGVVNLPIIYNVIKLASYIE